MIASEHKTFHTPVMVNEVISYLVNLSPELEHNNKQPMYIDATVGGGGHSQVILDRISQGIVVGLDLDKDAIEYCQARLKDYSNFFLYQTSYTNIDKIVQQYSDYYLQGVLFDLGVSYHQIATPNRGFSYNADGPLDMRFDQTSIGISAQQILQHTSRFELARIFAEFGEERNAKKIANHIFTHRQRIKDTRMLADLIRQITPSRFQNKTLSRIFQAIRIAVNSELENVKIGLQKAIQLLHQGGRIVVISYHSLEDRIVKQTFKQNVEQAGLKILTTKPIKPQLVEVKQNPSARSAKLRAIEKTK